MCQERSKRPVRVAQVLRKSTHGSGHCLRVWAATFQAADALYNKGPDRHVRRR
jgi:hypothetical protein